MTSRPKKDSNNKRHKMVLLATTLLLLTIYFNPLSAFAASEHTVNYIPRVRDNHTFGPLEAPILTIEEYRSGQFREEEVVRLHLVNAEWESENQMPSQTQLSGSATGIQVRRITSNMLQVTLKKDPDSDQQAVFGIPLFAKTTDGGYATVRLEPWTGGVTAETLAFAEVVGDSSGTVDVKVIRRESHLTKLKPESVADNETALAIEFKETVANAIGPLPVTFQMTLQGGEWFNSGRLTPVAMAESVVINSGGQVRLERVQRVGDTMVEVTISRDQFSDEAAVITLPLYFQVTGDDGDIVSLRVGLKDRTGGSQTLELAAVEDRIAEDEGEEGVTDVEQITPEEEISPQLPADIFIPTIQFFVNQRGYISEGIWQQSDAAPYVMPLADGSGRVMVPVSYAARALGADIVQWNPTEKRVTVQKGDTTLALTIGSYQLFINGTAEEMDVPAVIKDGRTMIPVAHLAKALQVEYSWNHENQTVTFVP